MEKEISFKSFNLQMKRENSLFTLIIDSSKQLVYASKNPILDTKFYLEKGQYFCTF